MARRNWIEGATALIGARQAELKLALRVTIAGTLAFAITRAFDLPQGYWAAITAVVVMQASLGASLKAAIERFSGTVAGALYGGMITAFIPHDSALSLGFGEGVKGVTEPGLHGWQEGVQRVVVFVCCRSYVSHRAFGISVTQRDTVEALRLHRVSVVLRASSVALCVVCNSVALSTFILAWEVSPVKGV